LADFAAWSRLARDPSKPLVWFHAPSVGEGLQARAVLEALQGLSPGVQTAFTHFSPSAEKLAASMPADVAGYLPWDLSRDMGRALDALRPQAVAFTKTEIWPVLVQEATSRGVPTVLVAGTLPETAGRLRGPARWLLAPSFKKLEWVSAISGDDAERFSDLGVPVDRRFVDGDPGVDSAAQRAQSADPAAPFLAPFHADPRPTLVAGSTWPEDEEVLLPALTRVRTAFPDLRLIIAPHEPDPGHLGPLEAGLTEGGWRHARLEEVERTGNPSGIDAVVVDRVGVLAHLYTIGSMAYVGGGFGGDGLHSVLEPASAGLPVLYGPNHDNSLSAQELKELGGGVMVRTVAGLAEVVGSWMEEPETARGTGLIGFGYISRHRGAARRVAQRINGLLPGEVGSEGTG
jgi:3-deoxy-D-manno-octulosonic-acid transferase